MVPGVTAGPGSEGQAEALLVFTGLFIIVCYFTPVSERMRGTQGEIVTQI